ncbi:MAG: anthranilate synthase component I [Calditrichaeota bacterium]|nr:MAG: anthranilate synthase component I [Calditrichota bacterium]
MLHPPSFSEFQQLAMHGNVIPVVEGMLADLLTPVAAFLKLCREQEEGFLLESVEGGEKVGRYSFLGWRPRKTIIARGTETEIISPNAHHREPVDVFTYLQRLFRGYRFVNKPGLPRFSGGVVGYFGYDTVRLIERLPQRLPPRPEVPQAALGFYDTILAFDHVRHQILIITNVILEPGTDLRAAYGQARERIEEIKEKLRQPLEMPPMHRNGHADVHSNFTEGEFCRAVQRAKAYIRAGDIFQVVLSQRFSRPLSAPPFQLYRALRLINPSPYLYFLRHGNQTIIGGSPELMVRVENGEVVVRPIAGTRPRGSTPEEDARLAADLLADEKELAEHAMLVDLGRNDVGRVSQYGTVRVTEKMVIERYSHVMHIVSEVRGRLRPELDALEALKACFPAGTVSGAPKIRAMEIIEELEPERRGVYSGALGYLDFSGNMDTCITIRTVEVREGMAHFQAGAGIVADSIPEREYQETIHKSNALRAAIALAEGGL